jgi:hypothetical protein
MNNKRLSDIGKEVGELCEEKNEAYGDSFAKAGAVLEELYPNGVLPEQYTDMLGVIRVLDKLFRIATKKDAFGESPWRDVAGYGILGTFNDYKDQLDLDSVINTEVRLLCHDRRVASGKEAWAFLPDGSPVYNKVDDVDSELPDELAVFEYPLCEDCYHMLLRPDEMPCKKCIDKPFKPHFTLSLPVYAKPGQQCGTPE